jgi:hypothetical protein
MDHNPTGLAIVFRNDRAKNRQALVDLDIRPIDRISYIRRLTFYDYCQGPQPDTDNPPPGKGPLWVFGTLVKSTMVYIKIQLGDFNGAPICISFHPEERPLRFPFRT